MRIYVVMEKGEISLIVFLIIVCREYIYWWILCSLLRRSLSGMYIFIYS